MSEEIEELDNNSVEVFEEIRYDLMWTCPNCKSSNCETDITTDGMVECICYNCDKKYQYYHCIY